MKHSKKPIIVKKPWGQFSQFTDNEKTTVKIIQVKKGGLLSLQLHNHRDELWVALDSGILAQVGAKKTLLKKGQAIFAPKKTIHRLGSKKGGRILEISFGKFDENDIVRLEDKYGRTGKKAKY